MRRWNIYAKLDFMTIAKIFVYIGGGDFAGRYRLNYRRWACDAIAARKDAGHVLHARAVVGANRAPTLQLNAGGFERLFLDALSDRHENDVCGNARCGRGGVKGLRTSVRAVKTDYLRLDPEFDRDAMHIRFYFDRRVER